MGDLRRLCLSMYGKGEVEGKRGMDGTCERGRVVQVARRLKQHGLQPREERGREAESPWLSFILSPPLSDSVSAFSFLPSFSLLPPHTVYYSFFLPVLVTFRSKMGIFFEDGLGDRLWCKDEWG